MYAVFVELIFLCARIAQVKVILITLYIGVWRDLVHLRLKGVRELEVPLRCFVFLI